MDRAFSPGMRIPRILLATAALTACGDDPTIIDGRLAEGAEATHVWVLGAPERAAVSADSFRLEGVPEGLLDLRFAADDEEVARMEIQGVAPGDRLRLRRIWFEDGVAFPAAVEREGEGTLTVNGMRMSGEAAIPARVDVLGTVLAASREGDAMILRPVDPAMPDLRVVVTPGTSERTPDGDPADAEELEFGDSVRVVGQTEQGFVIATELILPRSRASGASLSDGDEAEPRVASSAARPAAREPATAEDRSRADGGNGRESERDKEKREEKEKKGKGKGRGKH
jgi:hypothetical protein